MDKVVISCEGADYVRLEELKPFQGNLKKLSDANYKKLRSEIINLGFSEPISVWKQGGARSVLNGHQRLTTLRRMEAEGMEIPKIPVSYVDARDEKQAKLKVLALTSQYGQMTNSSLDDFLEEAGLEWKEAEERFRFPEVKWPKNELDITEDEAPPLSDDVITKSGDLWELGDHKLWCGDCKDIAFAVQADLLFTDPPYGVSYADKNKFLNAIDEGNRNQKEIESDHKKPEEMYQFWLDAFSSVKTCLKDGASYYVTGPQGGDLLLLLTALRESGFPLRHMMIWAKNNHVLGRCDYHYKHEPVIYGWLGSHKFYGGRGETSLWNIDKPQQSKLHPTMKPVALYAKGIQNSSKEGDIVLDPFGGSGTCVIASEQLNRKCYTSEIDPQYCDVIVKRWENLTGRAAKHVRG